MSDRDEQRIQEVDEQEPRAKAGAMGEEGEEYEGLGEPGDAPFPPGDSEVQTRV